MKGFRKIQAFFRHRETVLVLLIGLLFFALGAAVIVQSGGYHLTAEELKKDFTPSAEHTDKDPEASAEESSFNYENPTIVPGNILDRNGTVLCDLSHFDAETNWGNYIDAEIYSPLIGWMHASEAGSSGLMNQYYRVLRDSSGDNFHGKDVYLTLDHTLQKRVYDIYCQYVAKDEESRQKIGSALVMDVSSGEMLACVAFPTYDITKWREGDINTMNQIPVTHTDAMLPGSTFKLLTSVLWLEDTHQDESGSEVGNDAVTFPMETFEIADKPITNWNGFPAWIESLDYVGAIEWSSNVFFAQVMLNVKDSVPKLREICQRIHIGEDWALDFGTNVSRWLLAGDTFNALPLEEQKYMIANTGYGQEGVLLSSVSDAMIGAAMCNGGEVPVPHMIHSVVNSGGFNEDLDRLGVSGLSSHYENLRLTTAETAGKIYQAMQKAALNPAVIGFEEHENIAAKTGTAEVDVMMADGTFQRKDHTWMVACKEIDGRQYVVVVNQALTDLAYSRDLIEPVRDIFAAVEEYSRSAHTAENPQASAGAVS